MTEPTTRFSNRAENYARYRPSYPESLIDFLFQKWQSSETGDGRTVADLGAGSGIFSKLLLERNCFVYGVEPNLEMRNQSQASLMDFSRFSPVAGEADKTSLPDRSCDLVSAAQSFHWFATKATVDEIKRILKPTGKVALIWNLRTTCPGIMADYESLLCEYGTDYSLVSANVRKAIAEIPIFFPNSDIVSRGFSCNVKLNWEDFLGRHLSLSYVPLEKDSRYEAMLANLQKIFEHHQTSNNIVFKQTSLIHLISPSA